MVSVARYTTLCLISIKSAEDIMAMHIQWQESFFCFLFFVFCFVLFWVLFLFCFGLGFVSERRGEERRGELKVRRKEKLPRDR